MGISFYYDPLGRPNKPNCVQAVTLISWNTTASLQAAAQNLGTIVRPIRVDSNKLCLFQPRFSGFRNTNKRM